MSEQTGSWQPDPFGRNQYRYWDGTQWTDQVSNDGVVTTDPAVADPTPPAEATPPAESAPAADAAGTPTEPTPAVSGEATPPADEPAGWGAPTEPAPTAAVPATEPTPVAEALGAPGGPTYQEPVPAGAGDDEGGSKLPLIIAGVGVLALILGVGAYFLFFSGDDDDDLRGELAAAFEQQPFNLSSDQAKCVADELDDDDVESIHRGITGGGSATDAQKATMVTALRACDAPVPDILEPDDGDGDDDDGDDPDTTTTTEPDDDSDNGSAGGSGDGLELPPAMISMIAEQMAAEMGITQDQAECFVEGLMSTYSFEQLEGLGTDPDSMDLDDLGATFQIFEDCGINPLDLDPSGSGTTPSGGSSYGDDPALDALWDACENGDGTACDDLYFQSPLGSEYERFGDTCGGRFDAGTVFCADAM